MDNKTQHDVIQRAVQLAKNGQKQSAAGLLARVVRANPRNETAWLWLAACVSHPQQQLDCLNRALKLNPNNPHARQAVIAIHKRVAEADRPAGDKTIPVTRGAAVYEAGRTRVYMPRSQPAGGLHSFSTADTQPITRSVPPPGLLRGKLLQFAAAFILVGLLGLILYFFTSQPGDANVLAGNRLAPGGRHIGPEANLAAIIAQAGPDETIYLSAGTFTLEQPIQITHPLSLSGAGMSLTRIVIREAPLAFHFSGEGTFSLEGIEFIHEGQAAANLVQIDSGQFRIKNCRFAGAVYDSETHTGGRGLSVGGSAEGEITQSEALDNGYAGVEIREQAQVTLRDSAMHDNGGDGILVRGSARAVVERTTLHNNQRSGLTYLEDSSGKAASNQAGRNGDSGLLISDRASPLIYSNESSSNYQFGIRVAAEASPILLSNTTQRNARAGIAYFDRAAGAAEDNECSENELHGISVNGEAQPFLRGNRCNRNRQVGFDYWGSSGGTAANNECSQNGLQGIAVHEFASPTLENNACKNNQDSGIIYWGSAAGTARNNECSGNKINGISVHDQSQPVLIQNSCLNNTRNGISYYEETAGEARENICSGNSQNAISLQGQAAPAQVDNRCTDP